MSDFHDTSIKLFSELRGKHQKCTVQYHTVQVLEEIIKVWRVLFLAVAACAISDTPQPRSQESVFKPV